MPFLQIIFLWCVILEKIKLTHVVPKIKVKIMKTIAITAQILTEQIALPFLNVQLCRKKHEFSKQCCLISEGDCSSSFTIKVTLDELLNSFPLTLFDATQW